MVARFSIPTPFARHRRETEPPERDPLDVDIPFGLHPLVDYIRFQLLLLRNQLDFAGEMERVQRNYRRLRWLILAVAIASIIATLAQGMTIIISGRLSGLW